MELSIKIKNIILFGLISMTAMPCILTMQEKEAELGNNIISTWESGFNPEKPSHLSKLPIELITKIIDNGISQIKADYDSLLSAIQMGNYNKLKELLEKPHIDANMPLNRDGDIPLMIAVRMIGMTGKNGVRIVNLLFDHNANPNKQNNRGYTALIYAVLDHLNIEIVKLLLDHNADSNIQDKNGSTALIYEAQDFEPNIEILKLLLDYDANPNIQNNLGHTALIYAVENNLKHVLKSTLNMWSMVNIQDNKEDTDQTTVGILLHYGANTNIQDNQGMTPLMHAVKKGLPETIKPLLDYGADIYKQDNQGMTALDLAQNRNHQTIIDLLIKAKEKADNSSNVGTSGS